MKRILVLSLLLSIGLLSCQKKFTRLQGTYTGLYKRQIVDTPIVDTANMIPISIDFNENRFQSSDTTQMMPRIFRGTFKIDDAAETISFINDAQPNSVPDSSFILNGYYRIHFYGHKIDIWRNFANSTRDFYTLKQN